MCLRYFTHSRRRSPELLCYQALLPANMSNMSRASVSAAITEAAPELNPDAATADAGAAQAVAAPPPAPVPPTFWRFRAGSIAAGICICCTCCTCSCCSCCCCCFLRASVFAFSCARLFPSCSAAVGVPCGRPPNYNKNACLCCERSSYVCPEPDRQNDGSFSIKWHRKRQCVVVPQACSR
jgi:hypothetical protein